jgi:hypothetical protein
LKKLVKMPGDRAVPIATVDMGIDMNTYMSTRLLLATCLSPCRLLFNFNHGICVVASFTVDKSLHENHRWAVNKLKRY